jgi:Sulfotransferase domain
MILTQQYKNLTKRIIARARVVDTRPRMRPVFLVIGAQKSGTASLFWYLIGHHQYARPLMKEVQYFDIHYRRGVDWYSRYFPASKHPSDRLIADCAEITGEATPEYILNPWVPQRVYQFCPEMKIIVLLRDPVERALSHYYHNVRRGKETAPHALAAFELENERTVADAFRMHIDPAHTPTLFYRYSYLARGLYAQQLSNWFTTFARDQMLVLCAEEFFSNTDCVFRQICRFLEIQEVSLPAYPPFGAAPRKSMCEGAIQFARSYFARHNADLWDVLGMTYEWSA